MRGIVSLIVITLIVLVLIVGTTIAHATPVTIVLRSTDYGTIRYREYIPRPDYRSKSLTCVEVARELLLKAVYGEDVDHVKLNYVLSCYRDGYFVLTPRSKELSPESTLYATWLLRLLDYDIEIDLSKIYSEISRARTFSKVYYLVMTLKVLGYQFDKSLLEDFELQSGVSELRNSSRASEHATALWLNLYPDDYVKAYSLLNSDNRGYRLRARIVLKNYTYRDLKIEYDWFSIETLLVHRPVFVNATIEPLVIVKREPELIEARVVRWYSEPVEEYKFSWRVRGGVVYSYIYAESRVVRFDHLVGRGDSAVLTLRQLKYGMLDIECTYRHPYTLVLSLGGIVFNLTSTDSTTKWRVQVPLVGSYRVEACIIGSGNVLRGSGVVYLEPTLERSLLDYAWLTIPAIASTVVLVGARGWRRRLKISLPAIMLQIVPLGVYQILEVHPLWYTLGVGVVLLIVAWIVDRVVLRVSLEYIAILSLLSVASFLIANPLVLLLGGIGSAIFLASALLYPSERPRTERLYKSVMVLYSLGVLVSSLVVELSTALASFLYAPDEAFVDSIRVQSMFIANLISIVPILAPIVHLARLVLAFERAREVEGVIRQLEV